MQQHPGAHLAVFAVWEPMLPTDWTKPWSGVLRRLADRRVSQFWDRRHVLAQRMARDARDPQPKPQCCRRRGVLWDLAAVYPSGAMWNEALPPAVVFDGTVVHARPQIEAALEKLLR